MKQAVILITILAALAKCATSVPAAGENVSALNIESRLAPIDGSRFIASLTNMNWFGAYGFCSQQNATLLSLEMGKNDNKKKEFTAFIKLYHLESHEYWLSGTRLEDDVTFRWGLGGLPISQADWAPSQPDNLGGQQRCMKLFTSIKWDDEDCFAKFYAACQKY
ncbi:C-type lectin 37Db [Zeugodacus cucurbitae]|uniref:C-type lectin 37Db n=1 Tax=Zeugodacus cucurbitae TaxID=28588 RepID=UPI0023D950D3|nr:C-type lectin 37Db [Zeugodacus cucurbitae]